MHKALLLLLISALPLTAQAQREVVVWTYHQIPPFILDKDNRAGLSFDLVALLNQHAQNRGRFAFSLVYLPRKRLDMHLQRRSAGLVLWVNPKFFKDSQSQSYQWTPALLHDQQEFVSRAERPFDYSGPESLHGRPLGGVLGHRYAGIQAHIDRGLIQREDVLIDEQNLNKLLSKRLDVILMPRSTARFYRLRRDLDSQLHFSATPLNRYSRQLLLQPSLAPEVRSYIQDVIAALPQNPDWQALLKSYGLD
jgi:polar amino acid transport system substrate-binding protein